MIRVAGCVAVAAGALAFSACKAHGDRDKVERQLFEEVPALIGKTPPRSATLADARGSRSRRAFG